jgi:2-polyprenyl-3-methyl-5-hydroxy-6-metoxy-1,4-benzoquinol methylase
MTRGLQFENESRKTELYDKYHEHFLQMNRSKEEEFESVASSYSAWYQKFLPRDKNARILDIGCGMGHFLYFVKKQGYLNYWGIDISAAQVQFVRENITDRVAVADVFDYLETHGAFNLISANDILEHIPKAKTLDLLSSIYDSLERNGLLFVKTPNMSNPFSLRFRYIDYTHEVAFTEESLRQVLNAVGFYEIQVMGASYVIRSFKSWIGKLGQHGTHKIVELMLKMQGYSSPNIIDSHIIAICTKK